MVVIDYPSVGDIAESKMYVPIDEVLSKKELELIQRISIGKTYESYSYNGHLWALPIDAATQVSAYREDMFKKLSLRVPKTWRQVTKLKCKIGMPYSEMENPFKPKSKKYNRCRTYYLRQRAQKSGRTYKKTENCILLKIQIIQ